MKERLSITWSNQHQALFDRALTGALNGNRLTINPDGSFELAPDFFDQVLTRDFLDCIPEDSLREMIQAWVDKRTRCT